MKKGIVVIRLEHAYETVFTEPHVANAIAYDTHIPTRQPETSGS